MRKDPADKRRCQNVAFARKGRANKKKTPCPELAISSNEGGGPLSVEDHTNNNSNNSNKGRRGISELLDASGRRKSRSCALRGMLDETDRRLLQAADALKRFGSNEDDADYENDQPIDALVREAVEKETLLWDGIMSTIARQVYSWDHEKGVLLERIRRRTFQLIQFFMHLMRAQQLAQKSKWAPALDPEGIVRGATVGRRRSSTMSSGSFKNRGAAEPMNPYEVAEANKRIDDYGDISTKHRELVVEAKKRLEALGESLDKKRTGKKYLAPRFSTSAAGAFLGFWSSWRAATLRWKHLSVETATKLSSLEAANAKYEEQVASLNAEMANMRKRNAAMKNRTRSWPISWSSNPSTNEEKRRVTQDDSKRSIDASQQRSWNARASFTMTPSEKKSMKS